MSRSIRRPLDPGTEWWGKRPMAGMPKGSKRNARWFKRRLHKLERSQARAAIRAGE